MSQTTSTSTRLPIALSLWKSYPQICSQECFRKYSDTATTLEKHFHNLSKTYGMTAVGPSVAAQNSSTSVCKSRPINPSEFSPSAAPTSSLRSSTESMTLTQHPKPQPCDPSLASIPPQTKTTLAPGPRSMTRHLLHIPTHTWSQYGIAAWTGISDAKYYGVDHGEPDLSVVRH